MTRETAATVERAFVGRGRELALLLERLHAAQRGRGCVCLVAGEAGIGKSRLIDALCVECERLGVAVHTGLAWEAGGAPAYWPWIQVLRSALASEPGRQALEELGAFAAPLAQLVPELVCGRAERLELAPDQARFRLMDCVAGVLRAAAARAPLAIVLEDLHAADTDSIVLLEFASRVLRSAPLLFVATYRDAQMLASRSSGALQRLRRDAVEVHLGRLGRDEVREYLRAATGSRPLEQTVTDLLARTEGHPLYLAEVVALGIARGSFDAVPESLRTAILERAAALPPRTRERLAVASVLGREFSAATVAELAAEPLGSVEADLAPALAARLLEPLPADRLRFEHVLVREALHESLPLRERRALHERRAAALEQEAAAAQREPAWAALAHHLEESGPAARIRAMQAWRNAARQADARQALDDAALCCARALAALERCPDAAARERLALMLDLAAAQVRAGDFEAGRRNSIEAFAVARRLGDPQLIADAALTYGTIFTYGEVDGTLVELLRAALDALGERSTERRARLLARLAAALQPAPDPTHPMRLAREAIALARRTGDGPTLLATLRNAVSALMDVGDPAERLALNREHAALARTLGEPSESMRAHMRIVVDAMELADPHELDEAIERCEQIARQLALPSYQWTAESFRAMRATMRGEFALAEAALAQATRLAERTQDPNAARTLAIQRLALAEGAERDAEAERLAVAVERMVAEVPMGETFLRPGLLALKARLRPVDCASERVDAAYVASVVQFRDLGAIMELGEFVAAAGDLELAATLHAHLAGRAGHCGHWGLFGTRWVGPAARVLGLLAAALGRPREADEHFAAALEIERRMGAHPWIARTSYEWARALLARGDAEARVRARALAHEAGTLAAALGLAGLTGRLAALGAAEAPAARPPTPQVAYFRLHRDGETWVCECEGRAVRLRDSRGLQMLARLVAAPMREFHALDLATPAGDGTAVDAGDAGALLDERARREYRARVSELRSEIEEAEALRDAARAEAARLELEELQAELSRAFGLGGRARRAGSAAERARVNVQRRIKDAIRRIAAECPPAGRHLEWAVHTGTFCSYRPG